MPQIAQELDKRLKVVAQNQEEITNGLYSTLMAASDADSEQMSDAAGTLSLEAASALSKHLVMALKNRVGGGGGGEAAVPGAAMAASAAAAAAAASVPDRVAAPASLSSKPRGASVMWLDELEGGSPVAK